MQIFSEGLPQVWKTQNKRIITTCAILQDWYKIKDILVIFGVAKKYFLQNQKFVILKKAILLLLKLWQSLLYSLAVQKLNIISEWNSIVRNKKTQWKNKSPTMKHDITAKAGEKKTYKFCKNNKSEIIKLLQRKCYT